jgi:hypothetical protein
MTHSMAKNVPAGTEGGKGDTSDLPEIKIKPTH